MLIELRGLEVYDRVATTQMTQEEYYRLLVDNLTTAISLFGTSIPTAA